MEGWVKNAVVNILLDLSDRKGLGGEWDLIDDDIQEEIRKEWCLIIKAAFNSPHKKVTP